MRILLIFPPADIPRRNIKNCMPPLGLAYLGASLERAGHEVTLLDSQVEGFTRVKHLPGGRLRFGLSAEQIGGRIRDLRPDVIGVSCPFSQMGEQSKEVLRIAKCERPEATTVFGGLHPSLFPEDALSEPAVDFVLAGQADRSFVQLLQALQDGGDPMQAPGVMRRGQDGAILEGPAPDFIRDLDSLPFPAWRLLPMEKYFTINIPHGGQVLTRRVAPIMTSRGCPFNCGFCNAAVFWGHRIAFRSPANVVAEIEMMYREYRVAEVHFEDDNMTCDRGRSLELFRLMAERVPGMRWNVPNGIAPWTLDDELLEAMRASGCYEVALAVESGTQRVLTKVIGKPDFLSELPRIVATCKRLGIFVHGFFMVGSPSETPEEIRRTIETPFRLGFQDATLTRWVPVPKTRLFEEAVAMGMIRPEEVTFQDIHMTGRAPRHDGVPLEQIERMIARANWRMKLGLIRSPRLFYCRYVRPVLRNPYFALRYALDQVRMALWPKV